MIGHASKSPINRCEGLTTGVGAGSVRSIHPAGFTCRDIEAEILVRLARKGYDWTGTMRRRRRRYGPAAVACTTRRRAP
jgi:hypothetical protein